MLLFSGEVIDFAYLTQHLLGNVEQTLLVLLLLRQALPRSVAGAARRGEERDIVSVEESESASQSQRCKRRQERSQHKLLPSTPGAARDHSKRFRRLDAELHGWWSGYLIRRHPEL